jgi:hypothetical protein
VVRDIQRDMRMYDSVHRDPNVVTARENDTETAIPPHRLHTLTLTLMVSLAL